MPIRLVEEKESSGASTRRSENPRVKSPDSNARNARGFDALAEPMYKHFRRRRIPSLLQITTTGLVAIAICYIVYHAVSQRSTPASAPKSFTPHAPDSGSTSENGDFYNLPTPLEAPSKYDDYVPCYSARGKLLSESPDDVVEEAEMSGGRADEIPLGSYKEIQLKRTWTTVDGRYGPYGRGQYDGSNPRESVAWQEIDWAQLQNNCTSRNLRRFGDGVLDITPIRRMEYPNEKNTLRLPPRPSRTTGRQAIVLRGWEEFEFLGQDKWHLRALISEAALGYSGDYGIFLLVDVHKEKWKVFESDENYETALNELVPPEFRNITVFFDYSMLEAWYPKTPSHGMARQVFQPLQLFAHFFPDYDHYWQLEMDARFTGHAGRILDAIATFARNEPRKQSRERSSFSFSEHTYPSYSHLIAKVNETLDGGSAFWTTAIPEIEQIGPKPPCERPEDDNFEWGVGEEADCVILGKCHNLTTAPREQYRNYIYGFKNITQIPRVICPPASSRNSWNLLNEVHFAQYERGLAVPSEGTMPSFAMWLGLKISRPPFPVFLHEKRDGRQLDVLLNGGLPQARFYALAHPMGNKKGTENRRKHGVMFDQISRTWAPQQWAAQKATDVWLKEKATGRRPRPLYVSEDKLWMPNTLMHPVKTNANGDKNFTGSG